MRREQTESYVLDVSPGQRDTAAKQCVSIDSNTAGWPGVV